VTDLFLAQSRRVLGGLAHELGCEPRHLTSESLEVVERPAPTGPGKVALAATCGLGTVLSVPAPLAGWVRDHAPPGRHFRAMQPFFLAELAAEIERSGLAPRVTAHGFSQGFALNELSALPAVPAGYSLVPVDRDWMARYRPANVFDNALGEPGELDRVEKTARAFAVLDSAGEPAAVAGWWADGHGREEIGVDVRRDSRGIGLAKLVVIAATRQIVETGGTPFYSCGATNVRSHRNALSCGFLPVFLIGYVWAPGELASP
jgi:hypothetical protein